MKDRRKLTSILKEGSNYLEEEDKVLFGEGFQKKVNETVKSKRKQRNFLENIQNQQRDLLVITIVLGPFQEASIGYRSSQTTSVRTSPEMVKGSFMEGTKVKNQPQMIPSSSMSKGKDPEILPLRDYKNVHPLVKILFEEPIETFPLAGRLRCFLSN